ncbi:unnamed protein product [Acanthoscelides obtectus]|uniref:Uncharacterized protein n=1 Tax=Acanthoscelides obtectus TaxID=200917 RepID=A0A9P0KMZ0_ACAOB|nr:unnamed protein product [Acanthoscelides obtectus]CAK1654713.1 Fungal protease inhibitor-1 [Acanthoscelides obtectus]
MKAAIIGLFVLVAIALTFEESEAVACTQSICKLFKCTQPKCISKQVLVKKGGFCGCCDLCVTILKEGDNCLAQIFSGGTPATERCGDGLQCINGVCKSL